MSSLRARVLASVLALAAVGMVAVAAVTYAEQRSFLFSRVDQQARAAIPYMSRLLDSKGFGLCPASPSTAAAMGPAAASAAARRRASTRRPGPTDSAGTRPAR